MTNGSNTIGLCMIVKNEANLIRRCLASALPLVDYILVVDTGSTDGTQQIVCDFLDEHGIPGAVIDEPWRDFAYNRSFALERLREVPGIDYALILDADDVLVVDPGFDAKAFKAQMRHDHYDVLVDEGAVTHFRGQICSNQLPYAYKGVLHEYLEAPPGERGHTKATGFSIRASRGGARSQNPRKYHDDAAVLQQALTTETDPGLVSRYTFYLAQSYRDAGRLDEAAKAYAKRAEMGGWDQEAWHARLAEARCLRDLQDEGGFLRQALAAFSQRPHRAEPLYDLARYHRDRGQHEAAALFAERGLELERPKGDTLFVEDFVYQWGLQEEYSIAANYARDPARKDRGFAACNWLALNRDIPDGTRGLARHNLRFYVEPASKLLPSFTARPVGFTPPDGWHLMNPSVTRREDEIVMVQRTVNFVLEDGNYRTPDDGPVVTRNFLLRLDAELAVESSAEILPPIDLPPPSFGLVLGFEDMRLFAWRGALWCIATLCELTQEGWRQQVLARIDESAAGLHRLLDWRVLEPPAPRRHEKNWMPCVSGDRLRFVYLCDPTRLVDDMGRTVAGSIPTIAAEDFRGGSQAIAFAGGRLALVHEVGFSGPENKQRLYHHRFVWFDDTYGLRGVSRPFIFEKPGIEFAAGLVWHPDGQRLIISYGVGDSMAWLATVDANDVRAALDDTTRLRSGTPAANGSADGPFLGAETMAVPSTGVEQLPSGAEELGDAAPDPESEDDEGLIPEVPATHSPAAVAGAPAGQDAPQTDQPQPELGSFGAEDFETQHALRPARDLHALVDPYPRVLIAILAKQKERPLPLFLSCIEGLDYPKSSIFLYVRTNNNTDRTEQILREWVERAGLSYAGVEFDAEPVEAVVEQFPPHEWNSTRFRVLGHIRDISLQKTLEHGCDFYFVCDTDNFIRSCTLKELVALNIPIVAPFLRVTNPTHTYSNFFAKTDAAGFYAGCEEYQWITHRWVRGVVEVPVVHCTYLVRSDVIPELHYLDGSDDWEFAVFCKSAREAGIPQYLDNRQVYGYITFDPESHATKVNVGGGASDQIGFARTELEKADGLNLPHTGQCNDSNGSTEEIRQRFTEISRRQLFGPGNGVGSAPDKPAEYRPVQQFMARNGGAGAVHINKISGFVISYNRADVVETCLRSLRFVDELIVVDKSSNDGTVEIARRYGDKVVVVPWTPTVVDTREYAFSLCSHDFVVYLDDDECLSPDAIKFIQQEVTNPTADVYRFPVRSYILGRFDTRRLDWPDYKDRAFRRGSVGFPAVEHLGPEIRSSKISTIPADSPICIHHFSVPTISNWIEKTNRYTSLPQRVGWVDALPLSLDLPKQSLDYWLRKGHEPDDYLAAFALSRMVYDVVDKLKRWEVEAGINGEHEFARLCAQFNAEYDHLERTQGIRTHAKIGATAAPVAEPQIGQGHWTQALAIKGEPMPSAPQTMKRATPLVFIHAAQRTSSTWFWSKFREHPATLCFYQPFENRAELTRDWALKWTRSSWQSRHSPTAPYYQEYLSLLRETGGVEFFDPAMTYQWFIPLGGLRGELRSNEKDYISLHIRHAEQAGRAPVLGFVRSLGRCWAIRKAFGGFNIFQYRNLWLQWLSFLSHERQGKHGFLNGVFDTICRDDDAYFSYLVECGLAHAPDSFEPNDLPLARGERNYPNGPRDEAKVKRLEALAEHQVFALFMGLHIYLYLHAQLSTDLTADVTRMARDDAYRQDIQRAIEQQTGLSISFSDVEDVPPPSWLKVDITAIDWEEIREHARVAVQMLSAFGAPGTLTENATAFIDSAIEEMRRNEAAPPTVSPGARIAKVEVMPPEPDDPSSWFDLAQSEYAAGFFAKAEQAYTKRVEMGGDAEEVWYARVGLARCRWALGDGSGFVRDELAAFNQQPGRAEPLFDLARFHRERGMHETAAHFAEAGLALGRPGDDAKFVEDLVYRSGLQEELSISAFYSGDPARKDRGFAACNWLALNRDVTTGARDQARRHLRFYAAPASELMPSFTTRPVGFSPPEGWYATNPSVARRGDETVMVQRVVNYLLEGGNYTTRDGAPITTRNFLLRLNSALDIESSVEILPPADLPPPVYGLALGFEDARLFAWRGALWCSATLRELTPEGWCQQVLARIEERPDGECWLVDWRVLTPEGPPRHEKNWMPLAEADLTLTGDETLRFIYLCDPTRLADETAQVVSETTPPISAEQFRGGTQAIGFGGGWLALIHEEVFGGAFADRVYHHRFVWFNDTYALRRVSRPFFLRKHGIEFAAGLSWHPDGKRLIVSFGVGDAEALIATVDAAEVRVALEDAERLPSGARSQTRRNTAEISCRELPAVEGKAHRIFGIRCDNSEQEHR